MSQQPGVQIGGVMTASDALDDMHYGASVAVSANGLVMAIGSPSRAEQEVVPGGVYLYDWVADAWVQRGAVLIASDYTDGMNFGSAVALSSNGAVLAVGASQRTGALDGQGGVYLYDWVVSTWVQRGLVLLAAAPTPWAMFGTAVALSSNGAVLAVGAPQIDACTVYDWVVDAWVPRTAAIAAPDNVTGIGMGDAVALSASGLVLACSAPSYGTVNNTNDGAVFLFDWTGTEWVRRTGVLAPAPGRDQQYGNAIAFSADTSVIAIGETMALRMGREVGSVYLYDRIGSTWVQRGDALVPPDSGLTEMGFGCGVAFRLSTLWVAAKGWSTLHSWSEGSGGVYGFSLPLYATSGNVTDASSMPAARVVRAYARDTGALLRETTSDASTGAFSLRLVNPNPVYVVAIDDDVGTAYNAIIFDRIQPD